jgi:hypothetical protein
VRACTSAARERPSSSSRQWTRSCVDSAGSSAVAGGGGEGDENVAGGGGEAGGVPLLLPRSILSASCSVLVPSDVLT